MSYIVEKRQIEIKDSCDVLVAGGGIAGIAAALSAARNGAKVILLERVVQCAHKRLYKACVTAVNDHRKQFFVRQ